MQTFELADDRCKARWPTVLRSYQTALKDFKKNRRLASASATLTKLNLRINKLIKELCCQYIAFSIGLNHTYVKFSLVEIWIANWKNVHKDKIGNVVYNRLNFANVCINL